MMPASAPSCCAQGVTAASYNEYAILGFSFGLDFMGETIGEARASFQQADPCRSCIHDTRTRSRGTRTGDGTIAMP
jgi:hypothetical protein